MMGDSCAEVVGYRRGGVCVSRNLAKRPHTSKYVAPPAQLPTAPENRLWSWQPKDINPMWLETQMKQARKSITMHDFLVIAQAVRSQLYMWTVSYVRRAPSVSEGYLRFRLDWNLARHIFSLQLRLVEEQVLWELGKPFSELCTGFRPIGEAGGAGTNAGVITASRTKAESRRTRFTSMAKPERKSRRPHRGR